MLYFHEITSEQRVAIDTAGWTWGDVAAAYKKPDWCDHPAALEGVFGCWGLTTGHVRGLVDCCDCLFCNVLLVTGLPEDTT